MIMQKIRSGQLGKLIATGSQAQVYAFGDREVVKLFHASISREDIDREFRHNRLVSRTNLRVPECRTGLVHCEDKNRLGIAYERIPGTTLLRRMMRNPAAVGDWMRLLVETQRGMHAIPAPEGMRDQRRPVFEVLGRETRLPAGQIEQLFTILDRLPAGDRLCHGDYGAQNVMVHEGRVSAVIDWLDGCSGNPLCDVARSWVILHFNQRTRPVQRWLGRYLATKYLAMHRDGGAIDEPQLGDWIIINLAIRLRDLSGVAEKAVLAELGRRLVERDRGRTRGHARGHPPQGAPRP